ncbi:hypothetical protein BgiBS90_004528, partial [Biomphalaria glabrata]
THAKGITSGVMALILSPIWNLRLPNNPALWRRVLMSHVILESIVNRHLPSSDTKSTSGKE